VVMALSDRKAAAMRARAHTASHTAAAPASNHARCERAMIRALSVRLLMRAWALRRQLTCLETQLIVSVVAIELCWAPGARTRLPKLLRAHKVFGAKLSFQ
jgi:hypothetical protein